MEQAVADRKETPIWFLHGVERNGICTQFIHIKNVQIASDLCSIYSLCMFVEAGLLQRQWKGTAY